RRTQPFSLRYNAPPTAPRTHPIAKRPANAYTLPCNPYFQISATLLHGRSFFIPLLEVLMSKPWTTPMPDEQFQRMRDILAAPSPVGLEGAMTYGVLKPMMESFMPSEWKVHQFRSNAGIVVDTAPDDTDALTVMFIGHADKIRLHVRSISEDGKIWVNSDSFLPQTLIGHEVTIFSENGEKTGAYRQLSGATIA